MTGCFNPRSSVIDVEIDMVRVRDEAVFWYTSFVLPSCREGSC
jgi:hypothetical protein